ncbi:hypothetical protein AVEN_182350-1 [Araneus ventricosus]|uniref:Cyclic nucleotide-binding domain-containing protein n=1 Tax=Araneus ventricosus TaxID=182803 RepID=A0A4Y2TT36_ARAVE|nr:hypothetical protein AVEN_182350-1 [Araneus ventricosus]
MPEFSGSWTMRGILCWLLSWLLLDQRSFPNCEGDSSGRAKKSARRFSAVMLRIDKITFQNLARKYNPEWSQLVSSVSPLTMYLILCGGKKILY